MSRKLSRVVGPFIAIGSMLPGLLLPFVVTLRLSVGDGDLYLLAMSVSLTLTSVVGNAIELNTVAEVGRIAAQGKWPSRRTLGAYQVAVLKFSTPVSVIAGTALAIVYALGVRDGSAFAGVVSIILLAPVLSGYTSLRSGLLIARGEASWAIAFQALRSLVPILALLLLPGIGAASLAICFVAGELARALAISIRLRRGCPPELIDADLPVSGLWWQAFSSGVSQGSRVVDRSFLTPVVGGISSYELADKAFFAIVQFLTLGILTPRVAHWAGLPVMTLADARRMLRKDLSLLVGGAVLLAFSEGVVLAVLLHLSWMPEKWVEGAQWAIVLSVALPFNILIVASGRLLIVARKQRWLLWTSTLTLFVNAVLDFVLFAWKGAIGIPIATVVAQVMGASLYVVLLMKALPKAIGSERNG